jgi:hypothetical protein
MWRFKAAIDHCHHSQAAAPRQSRSISMPACDDHASGAGRAVHVHDRHRRRSICIGNGIRAGKLHLFEGQDSLTRLIPRISSRPTSCRTQSRSAKLLPASSKHPIGTRKARKDPRRADRSCQHNTRYKGHGRPEGSGRSREASDRNRYRLGRQRAEGRHYITVVPARNDGTTVHKLAIKDVPSMASGP